MSLHAAILAEAYGRGRAMKPSSEEGVVSFSLLLVHEGKNDFFSVFLDRLGVRSPVIFRRGAGFLYQGLSLFLVVVKARLVPLEKRVKVDFFAARFGVVLIMPGLDQVGIFHAHSAWTGTANAKVSSMTVAISRDFTVIFLALRMRPIATKKLAAGVSQNLAAMSTAVFPRFLPFSPRAHFADPIRPGQTKNQPE